MKYFCRIVLSFLHVTEGWRQLITPPNLLSALYVFPQRRVTTTRQKGRWRRSNITTNLPTASYAFCSRQGAMKALIVTMQAPAAFFIPATFEVTTKTQKERWRRWSMTENLIRACNFFPLRWNETKQRGENEGLMFCNTITNKFFHRVFFPWVKNLTENLPLDCNTCTQHQKH